LDHTVTDRERADALLVLRCQLGERQAFDALIHRWSAPLHRYALKLGNDSDLAHELTQEVWLRVLQSLSRLRDVARFRPWLFGIAHRVFMDRLRSRYAMPVETGHDVEQMPAAGDEREGEDLEQALALGLVSLPLVEREVLTLFYLEELPLAEIASALEIPIGTVKSRLFRARTLLRNRLLSEESVP
jgi:RNA polymerase sigma-70 factor (ECF subfamily)